VVADVLPAGCASTLDADENFDEKLASHDGRRDGVWGWALPGDGEVSGVACALPLLPLVMECAEDGREDPGDLVGF